MRSELGFKTDLEYYVLGGGVGQWEWGSAGQGYPDTSEALRLAFIKNPYMKLFVASGYFDLATPFFATRYTLNHMELDQQQQAKNQPGLLRCRTHDVHQVEFAGSFEAGCVGVFGEGVAVGTEQLAISN